MKILIELSKLKFLIGSQLNLNRFKPNFIIKIPTGELRGYRWIFSSGPLEMALGLYERKKISLMKLLLKNSQIFFDVGAHTGYYSILASKLVGNEGLVFTFEPSKKNLKYLNLNLGLNYCTNVYIINACVGDKTGIVDFNSGPDSTMGYMGKGDSKVMEFDLDNLIPNRIKPPNLIKIDVEGAENLVLTGSINLLRLFKPKLLLATHSKELHLKCLKFLKDLNYKVILIEGTEGSGELLAY